jgi:alcohol dehydrogenase (cytochrome c)
MKPAKASCHASRLHVTYFSTQAARYWRAAACRGKGFKALPTRFALFVIVVLISAPVEAQYGGFLPVSDFMLQNPDPADWLMWRRTLNSWGYSPLNPINRSNVGQLEMIWSRGMGPGVQEAAPLVYRGVLYLPNPSDLVQASGLIWEYRPKLPEDVVPSINRSIAIYGDLIIDTSVDDFVYALDARAGKLAWENRFVD